MKRSRVSTVLIAMSGLAIGLGSAGCEVGEAAVGFPEVEVDVEGNDATSIALVRSSVITNPHIHHFGFMTYTKTDIINDIKSLSEHSNLVGIFFNSPDDAKEILAFLREHNRTSPNKVLAVIDAERQFYDQSTCTREPASTWDTMAREAYVPYRDVIAAILPIDEAYVDGLRCGMPSSAILTYVEEVVRRVRQTFADSGQEIQLLFNTGLYGIVTESEGLPGGHKTLPGFSSLFDYYSFDHYVADLHGEGALSMDNLWTAFRAKVVEAKGEGLPGILLIQQATSGTATSVSDLIDISRWHFDVAANDPMVIAVGAWAYDVRLPTGDVGPKFAPNVLHGFKALGRLYTDRASASDVQYLQELGVVP